MDGLTSKREKIRHVVFKDNREALVADWYYMQHADCFIKEVFENLLQYMESTTEEYWGDKALSGGECLDIAIELYDKGISYLS